MSAGRAEESIPVNMPRAKMSSISSSLMTGPDGKPLLPGSDGKPLMLYKDGVSADVTALAQEIFSLFDKDGDGYLLKQDALAALRSVGLNPEEKEVDHMLRVFVPIGESGLDFRTFMVMMSKVSRVGDCEEDMEEAFRVFDKGSSGVMTVADFRHILTTMGEKVSDEDMDDMLQYVTYNDRGDIKYRDFIKAMFSDGSTLPPIEMK